jgi:hypothetical protein
VSYHQRFRSAIEAGDLDAAVALFDPGVRFLSPVGHRPYQGREALRRILGAAFTVFEGFHYVAEYGGCSGHVLEFRASVAGLRLDGVDILRGDPDGPPTELAVLVRPYSAATELKERMGALLASR